MRVGAVRDRDAVDVRRGQQLVDALGELEPDLVVHVLAADAGDLLARDVGEVLELRDRLRSAMSTPTAPDL